MKTLMSAGAKAITMAIALVSGLTTTRLVITNAGVDSYALYTLLVGLPSLIAFADLGSGAVIVNRVAISSAPKRDKLLLAQVTTVGRITLLFAASVMVVNSILLVTGLWQKFLGEPGSITHAPIAAFLTITVFCIGAPIGIWSRLMLGLERNHITILLQGLQSPLTLLLVWLLLRFDAETLYPFLTLGSIVATLLVSMAGFALASHATSPLLRNAWHRILRVRTYKNARVMDMGWPMLAQVMTTPLAQQSQRFILAQSVGTVALAQYAMAGQFFIALQGLINTAGLTLWPAFSRARSEGAVRHGPFKLGAFFAAGALVFTAGIAIFGPLIFDIVSGGKVEVPLSIILAFGAMITCQAALYPLGMFLMDTAGVRFQVIPVLLMAVSTFVLALVLTPLWGVVVPMLANASAVIICQIVPYSIRIYRHWDELVGGDYQAELPEEVDLNDQKTPS